MKSNKLVLLFPVIFLMFACGGGEGGSNKALVSITVTPAAPSIAMATTQQFRAKGRYSDNSTQDLTTSVTWTSSNPGVATIATGLATSVAPGITTIKATSGSISGTAALTVLASNVLSITVNGSLCSSGSYPNKPCVSVTVCNPGTSTCQTITDILLDTGSTGLRIFKQALKGILPPVSSGLAECIQFADGSADWGPVQTADVVLGGEHNVTVPIQVIDATFGAVPAGCGSPEARPADAGFNGILGVGLFAEDCGSGCESAGNGMYYTCSGSGCSGSAVALAGQVHNPVAYLPEDNNGVLVQLQDVPLGGLSSADGQLVLGIGTRDNNTPTTEVAYPANPYAEFITVFNGITSPDSFIDSGTNGLFFSDSALLICGDWYCPPATTSFSARTEGFSGTPGRVVSFRIGNATSLFNSNKKVFVELGGAGSGFVWGLPFFYGRNVFVGIEGKSSPLGSGPYWAY